MFSFLRSFFANGPLYIKIKSDNISVLNAATGEQFEDSPSLALRTDKNKVQAVLAVGKEAELMKLDAETELLNAFKHPRTIIANFVIAEKTLQYFFRSCFPSSYFKPSPRVIIHPQEKIEGGLTKIEARALTEVFLGAGAMQAFVWTGRELTLTEIQEGSFPKEGWVDDIPDWGK